MISVICFSWMLAFASMTVGEASRAVGFFAVRAPSPCHAQSSSGILFPLSSCPTPIGHPGQRVLILAMRQGEEKRYQFSWMLAYASMTIGVVSLFVTPPRCHPLSLTRGSRAKIPYFSEASTPIKAVFMLPGSSRSQG